MTVADFGKRVNRVKAFISLSPQYPYFLNFILYGGGGMQPAPWMNHCLVYWRWLLEWKHSGVDGKALQVNCF